MQSFESSARLTRDERIAAGRVSRGARRLFLWGGLLAAAIIGAALISLYFYIDHLR